MGTAGEARDGAAEYGAGPAPPDRLSDARIAEIARGLAHPARVHIVAQLAAGEAHIVKDIADDLPLAQSTVSEHLRILRDAGILATRKVGPGTECRLRPGTLHDFAAAVAALTSAEHDEGPPPSVTRQAGRGTPARPGPN